MNDCLYRPDGGRVNGHGQLVAIFTAEFADQPDLANLSPAARRVLATAAALFHQRGAADTSVRDLTKACGLTPGALYNHFSSKDELLYTVVRHGHLRMRRRIDMTQPNTTPTAGFRAFVRAYAAGHVEHPELAQMVRREFRHLAAPGYAEIVSMRRRIRRQLTALLEAGQHSGEFALLTGPHGAVAQTLMVLDMCSRTSDWFDRTRDGDPATLVDRYELAALRLIGAATTSPPSGRAIDRLRN